MSADLERKLEYLLDREAIRDVIMRYCRGCDRQDEDVLLSVYWPDARDNHGVFSGSVTEYIRYLFENAAVMDQLSHLVGNMLIRNSGVTARCESYFHGYHRLRTDDGPKDMIAAGRYLDDLERRSGEWRIIRRAVVFDWFRYYDDSADWSQGIAGNPVRMGGRVPDDPSARLFAKDIVSGPATP